MKKMKKETGKSLPLTAENWYREVCDRPGPKFITGLRGIGKDSWLDRIAALLSKRGVASNRIFRIDSADPKWRQYVTCDDLVDAVTSQLPDKGKSYVLIREAASLHDAEVVIGALAASEKYEVVATSSSRRLLDDGLARYFSGRIVHVELLPAADRKADSPMAARARWNEMFLYDVLAPNRIIDTHLVNRTAEWLSDHLGEPTSLRIISGAVSPSKRVLSPHTIEAYLAALEDAHLVEKTFRYDLEAGVVSARNYKYFFTDPELRFQHFGPAPEDESRRMALNVAWLDLRRRFGKVYCTNDEKGIDFVTETDGGLALWRANKDGVPVEMS